MTETGVKSKSKKPSASTTKESPPSPSPSSRSFLPSPLATQALLSAKVSQTPVTPSRARSQLTDDAEAESGVQVTPYRQNSGSNHYPRPGASVMPTREVVKGWLKEDMMKAKIVTLDEYAELVLGLPKDTWFELEFTRKVFRAYEIYLLAAGAPPKPGTRTPERDLYVPLMKLLNVLGDVMKSDKIFYIQDAKPITGQRVLNKPDIVAVYRALMGKISKKDLEAFLEDHQFAGVFWALVLYFAEVKHRKGKSLLDFDRMVQTKVDKPSTRNPVSDSTLLNPPPPTMTRRNPRHAMSSGMILQNQLEGSKDESSSVSPDASQHSGRSYSGMSLRTLGNRSRSVNQGPSGSSQRPVIEEQSVTSWQRGDVLATKDQVETELQHGLYGQALNSAGLIRTHSMGIVVDSFMVQLHYYDRSMIIQTKPAHLQTDRQKLLASLCYLHSRNPQQLGILPHHEADFLRQTGIVEAVTRPIQSDTGNNRNWREIQLEKLPDGILIPEHGRSLEGSIYKMECHDGYTRTLQITKVLSRGDGLLGRVPTVVVAKCIKEQVGRRRSKKIRCWTEMGDLIVKFSFPAATRKAENAFISEARAAAVGADAWANDHLPNIVDFETLHFPIDSPQQRLHTRFPEEYELRVARIIVMEQLHSLEELDDVKDFAQVYFDILQIHRWLVEKPRILHRDLSMSNVMFRRNADGQVLGVLNDFDLSSSVRTKGASSDSRTGTKPFMASDHLLDREWERGHMYRHDLESLFCIMLIQCCHYSSPSQLRPDAEQGYRHWFIEADHHLVKTKRDFFITPLNNPPIHLYFERFRPWVTTIHAQFVRGFIRRRVVESGDPDDMALFNLSSASFDWDTLGGFLTYDSLYSIMRNFPCGDNSAGTEALIVRSSTVNLT